RPNAPPWTGRSWLCTGRRGSPRVRPPTTGPRRCCGTWPPPCAPIPTPPPTSPPPRPPPGGPGPSPPSSTGPPPPPPPGPRGRGRGGVVAGAAARRVAHRGHTARAGLHLAVGGRARPCPAGHPTFGRGGRGVASDARRRRRPVPVQNVEGRPQTQRRPDGGHP